ncbi:DUF3958 family protein [Enterococcus larvae]|uniref:DUF3958 family protein n=1 Tax=Enterococcus larvae TaxID=2794352 RepID=UPI003F3D81C5
MTKSLEEIQQEERQLEVDLEQVDDETRHLKQIEEEYDDFFYHTSIAFTEMDEQFEKNDFNWYLSDRLDGLRHQRFHIFTGLDEEQQQLNKQKQTITDTQSELFYERKTMLTKKEVSINER